MTGTDATVLVLAEMEGIARLYQAWLREEGYPVDVATTVDATSPSSPGTFDVLVVDRTLSTVDDPPVAKGSQDPGIVLASTLDRVFETIALRFDDYVLEPASKTDLAEALTRVRRRDEYGPQLQRFARSVVTVALVREGTTAEERESNEAYRALVERFLRSHAETSETIRELNDVELGAVFGGDRVDLVRHPTETLDVHPNAPS